VKRRIVVAQDVRGAADCASILHHAMADDTPRFSDDECTALFHRLFPQELDGADVFAALAPEGWGKSPLLAAFHPSPEQVWEEGVAMHGNITGLMRNRKPDAERKPAPTLDESRLAGWRRRSSQSAR